MLVMNTVVLTTFSMPSPGCGEKGPDVLQALFRLGRDTFGEFARGGIDAELSGAVQGLAGADGLGVRADGCGRIGGGEDGFHSVFLWVPMNMDGVGCAGLGRSARAFRGRRP